MKSKTVASIMRHVASKIPSLAPDGSEITKDPAAEEHLQEAKRHRRAAAKKGVDPNSAGVHEDDGGDDVGLGLNSNEEERLEQLYEKIAWPLGKKYGHPYDAFKLALTYVHSPPLSCSSLCRLSKEIRG